MSEIATRGGRSCHQRLIIPIIFLLSSILKVKTFKYPHSFPGSRKWIHNPLEKRTAFNKARSFNNPTWVRKTSSPSVSP